MKDIATALKVNRAVMKDNTAAVKDIGAVFRVIDAVMKVNPVFAKVIKADGKEFRYADSVDKLRAKDSKFNSKYK